MKIIRPGDIFNLLKKWARKREENFLLITLNGAHEVIKIHHITKGIVNKTIVHPRECFYPAIKDYAVSVVFAHNHPSGQNKPSEDDNEINIRLKMSSEILGFNMLDNLIITKNSYFSYREHGELYEINTNNKIAELIAAERS